MHTLGIYSTKGDQSGWTEIGFRKESSYRIIDMKGSVDKDSIINI